MNQHLNNYSTFKQKNKFPGAVRILLLVLLTLFFSSLVLVVYSMSLPTRGLSLLVTSKLDLSGVTNPVTAVLINFRGYDTLLEMAVLLLALVGILSFNSDLEHHRVLPLSVLDIFTRLLVPILILISGYLLWTGSYSPGGAFQAGAVLGAAGVLLLLSNWKVEQYVNRFFWKLALVSGLACFILTGLAQMVWSRYFLEYVSVHAGEIILLIESMATISIGFILTSLFLTGVFSVSK